MAGTASRLNGKKGGRPRKDRTAQPSPPLLDAAPRETYETQETQKPQETHAAPAVEVVTPLDNPHGLTPRELLFVEAYCGVANFNAAQAYKLAGYKVSPSSHASASARLCGKVRIAVAIATRLAVKAERLRIMDGDEALERLSIYARADIGKVLHKDDPIAQLPDEIRLTIKAVRPNAHGRTIELYDSMKATELMAKSAGKLKEILKVEHTLEEVLALSHAPQQAVA